MSGELKDPSKSIPKGTLRACTLGFILIITMAIFSGLTVNPTMMLHDCLYFNNFSLWAPIVPMALLFVNFAGILNNSMGAARILDAMSKDFMVGPVLEPMSSKIRPFIWMAITCLWMELFLLVGSMNKLAVISAVLHLISFSSVSVACLCLDLAGAPNFRPKFKYFSWYTSLTAIIGGVIMLYIVSPIISTLSAIG